MIATVLALVPDYGVYLIFGAVFLACLAVPVPASVLVLTSGSFVASGDLSLAAVLTSVLLAYVAGDQIAFLLASRIGARVLGVFERSERAAPVVDRSPKPAEKARFAGCIPQPQRSKPHLSLHQLPQWGGWVDLAQLHFGRCSRRARVDGGLCRPGLQLCLSTGASR